MYSLYCKYCFAIIKEVIKKKKKKKGKTNWGVTKVVLEVKRITDQTKFIFRNFGPLGRAWIHYYQQKFKSNEDFSAIYVCLLQRK